MTPAASSEERSGYVSIQAQRCAIERHFRKILRCQSASKAHTATNGSEVGNAKQGPRARAKGDVRGRNQPWSRNGLGEGDGELISDRNRLGLPGEPNHQS